MRVPELLELLPDVIRRTAADERNPLTVVLGAAERLHEPDERVLAELDRYFDPRRAPDEFIPYLAWWVDLAWLFLDPPDDRYATPGRPFAGGVGRLRDLVAAAARESKWRGTAGGLVRLLELATGLRGFRIDEVVLGEDGLPIPFRIQVHAPLAAEPYLELVRRIAEHEKPAHVTLHPVIVLDEEVGGS